MLADTEQIAKANARAAGASLGSRPAAGSPTVSVVVPCLNEERFIGEVLENLAPQYDAERFEIVVVDGRSEDSTRARVEEFAARHPALGVRLVDNPARHIPVALNLGVAAARGEIVVRMDAHSVPSANYV
ncbi:MAG TPA: glycosyltransferase, partial [Pyrinomonadaceae bacterium]|nr:glycosyltransferase [Pyrinomonadaceae bacterium]